MLATLYYPNTNPIGPASLIPLAIVTFYIVTVYLSKHRGFTLVAPICFAALAVSTEAFPSAARRFPNADDCVGYYIWALAACCFALDVARFGSKIALIYGAVVLFLMGGFLMMESALRSADLIEITRDLARHRVALAAAAVWCVLFTMLIQGAARRCFMNGTSRRSRQSIENGLGGRANP